jgi:integrase/recombinase XerD
MPTEDSSDNATHACVASEDVGQINLSPRVPALNGAHLNWLMDQYISACRTRLDHQVTVDGYEYQLLWFKHWWEEDGGVRQWLLRADDLIRFEKYLRTVISPATKRRLSYHTRATIVKRLREALHWAQVQGYLDRDYTKWVPKADGAPPKRKAAQISALTTLLEVAGQGREPLRDRSIVAMLMGMGLRREELSKLDIEEVVIEADFSGYAPVVGKRTKANPSGEREAAFDSATGTIIVAYLDADGRSSGPLFVGQRGSRLTGQGIYIMVKKIIARANLESQIIGPHDLRRAFATYYRRARGDKQSADLLRRQLGHAGYSQTDEYTLLDVNDIRLDMISPVALAAAYHT